MRISSYAPLDLVKRTNRNHKTVHDRLEIGVTIGQPIEQSPGQFYAMVQFPWSGGPIECNLRTIAPA
jgi:hypothetical protein